MRRALPVLLLVLSGCLYQPVRDDSAPPPAPAPVNAVADAAEASVVNYAAELARVARELSEKTGEFKSNGEVYDALMQGNTKARNVAFQKLADASDSAVDPKGQYDAKAVGKMLADQAEGFERVAKGK